MGKLLRAVAVLTTASGALLIGAPGAVIERLTPGRDDPLDRHLLGTVGMFMAVSGAMLGRAARPGRPDPVLLAWSAAEKLGASAAVAVGVRRRAFPPAALAVAGFDLASAVACMLYRRRLPRSTP